MGAETQRSPALSTEGSWAAPAHAGPGRPDARAARKPHSDPATLRSSFTKGPKGRPALTEQNPGSSGLRVRLPSSLRSLQTQASSLVPAPHATFLPFVKLNAPNRAQGGLGSVPGTPA